MQRTTPIKPSISNAVSIIWVSLKLVFKRLGVWLLPNLWMILLSIPIFSHPAASAALYKSIHERLLDPGDIRSNLREEFRSGFFKYFGYSIALAITNILLFVIILSSLVFWLHPTMQKYVYVAIIPLYIFVMWWLCQPFLFPAMLTHPELKIPALYKSVILLVGSNPFYSLIIAFTNTILLFLGLILLGPILLVFPALIAIISIQAYWELTGAEVPALVDPILYEDQFQLAQSKRLGKAHKTAK